MKRKLVEVTEQNHSGLVAIQDDARDHGNVVPSIPFLVNKAIERAYQSLVVDFAMKKPEYKNNNKKG